MKNFSNHAGLSLMLPVMLALGGCVTGPSQGTADLRYPVAYLSTPLSTIPGTTDALTGGTQKFVSGGNIQAHWWKVFRSKDLDLVIRTAMARNPTLSAAEATLRESLENYNTRTGSEYYPDVAANLSSKRMKSSPAAAGQPSGTKSSIFDLHNASVDVTYAFDIFGGGQRELDALKAQVDHQRFQLEAAYLSLTANIVTTVVKEASLREQLAALNDIVISEEKQLSLLDRQVVLGGTSRAEVLAQRAQLEQTRASVPPVEKELSQARHQLMLLAGKFPADESAMPIFTLSMLTLPEDLPVTLPSSLAHQRPDIRAAEAMVRAASARVGVASAGLYPQITLSGSYGLQSGRPADLFDPNSTVWNIAGGVIQPLFNGGRLRAQRRASVAAFEAANAQFRQTVLAAYANVADVLRALETDARTLRAQADAQSAAAASLEMSRQQLVAGAVNYIFLLNAQRQYQQSRISLIQARAARLSDTAALFQALGGGWWDPFDQGSAATLKE